MPITALTMQCLITKFNVQLAREKESENRLRRGYRSAMTRKTGGEWPFAPTAFPSAPTLVSQQRLSAGYDAWSRHPWLACRWRSRALAMSTQLLHQANVGSKDLLGAAIQEILQQDLLPQKVADVPLLVEQEVQRSPDGLVVRTFRKDRAISAAIWSVCSRIVHTPQCRLHIPQCRPITAQSRLYLSADIL